MLALYIHWPFCKAKCPYCDFNSHVREGVDEAAWREALLAELRTMAAWMPGERLSSIFFGGGTPSLMPPETVAALIDEAGTLFAADPNIEITLEANPTSVEAEKFAGFRAAGVNRVSLGVQSLRTESLRFLGREHSAQEALKAVELAAKTFDRFSFDLIYALPGQNAADWERELREALEFAGQHLSLYQLTIEPNTAFHHDYHVKEAFKLPKDTLASELFLLTQQVMEEAGLPAYEISNHAKPGEESRHNLTYWRGGAYLGVGPGAHGRVQTHTVIPAKPGIFVPHSDRDPCLHGDDALKWYATQTLKSPERWLSQVQQHGHALEVCQQIDAAARAEERLLTGLRLREGVMLDDTLQAALKKDKVDFYVQQGLLACDGDTLRATHEGWLVLNYLLSEILI